MVRVQLWVLVGCAAAEYVAELVRRVRERVRDPGAARDVHARSRRVLALTQLPSVIVALAAAALLPALAMPGPPAIPFALGLVLLAGGLALRWWAIVTLDRFFVGTIHIPAGHRIVTAGPYRRLRHPSYTGGWLFFAGIGLACGNWLGLAVCAALPLAGLVLRIAPEERALRAAAPGEYEAYARRTDRLIPFVW
jgi:protein-S-isoprenylcysteine O-methyltransferase Ste14